MTSIEEALQTIKELERMYDSDNIVYIDQLCNKLSVLTVSIGKQVSDARKLSKELEVEYDHLIETEEITLIDGGTGVAKAKLIASAKHIEKRRESLTSDNTFDRIKRFMDRCDKVLDAYKQYVSTVKQTNLKGV